MGQWIILKQFPFMSMLLNNSFVALPTKNHFLTGLELADKELKDLCSQLKKMCGTGGALKNGIIEIQGDNRDKIKATLEQLGHNVKLAGG